MAQKNINLGTGELTGDGESLRSALVKIEDNFTDVYNSAFSGDYNDLTNKPNTDLSQIGVNVLPDVDDTRDLGSPNKNWNDLYATKVWVNNSFALQDQEVGGAGLKLSILKGDGTTATIVADVEGYATQQYVTDAVQALDDDLRVGTPGALDSLNELAQAINNDPNFYQTVTSALAGKADTSSIPDLGAVSESIIPATDVAYDLGSATNRFRDIYLSGSTIDLGGLEISNVGGELQLGGVKIITQSELGSITQSDTGNFTSNFTTTITQDNQYTKFTKVDVFDDGETPAFTVNREIKLGANSLLFDSTVGATAVIGNSSVGGSLVLEAGSGNADEGNADGGDIVITSGYSGVGGDGGNIILNSNADIFVGPLANTLDIRIGGGPGYAGENNTFFYGNVNIDSGKKLDTESVTNSSGNLTLSADNYVIIDSDNNGQINIGQTSGVGNILLGNTANGTDVSVLGRLFVSGGGVPASSIGASGDNEGIVAVDNNYIYYCTDAYDGVTNIWKRVAWSGDTW